MKSVLSLLLIITCFISCSQTKDEKVGIITKEKINARFYTNYLLLERAYAKKDTALLRSFYEAWAIKSSKIKPVEYTNDTVKAVYEIFNAMYYPFDYTKYNWTFGRNTKEYFIIPTQIKYIVADSSITNDSEMNTLTDFYLNPDIPESKRLLDIDPFKKTMNLFLSKNRDDRLNFLKADYYFIDIPIDRSNYYTDPRVFVVEIDTSLKQAIVSIEIMETGIDVYLEYVNEKWMIKDIKEMWIA